MYFEEESGALDVSAKAKEADDKARGKKKRIDADVNNSAAGSKDLHPKAGGKYVTVETKRRRIKIAYEYYKSVL